ncbi:MAG TPA: DUF1592 domain-containing protein, partial [Planctomycetota bacterium]|nr:DUF1592 domain-containing protein [Planctomycetota bacterium]
MKAFCPLLFLFAFVGPAAVPDPDLASDYNGKVRPLLARYCLTCHSAQKKKGDLDLERYVSLAAVARDLKPWPLVIENLENGEMPPKKNPQPSGEEKSTITGWVRAMLDAEARARAGDPGRVVVRRLSNAELNNTIRDLTGVDLEPARDFPADGAAGEGFTNAGDALVTSPTLLNKYLNATKDVAGHAVLLPDGFRFSPSKTQRDWTDEATAALRDFLSAYTKDGKLAVKPYLQALVKHRDEPGIDSIAAREKLSAKYLGILRQALTATDPSFPLDRIRARYRMATPGDVDGLVGEITAWQESLWRVNKIGSYGGGKLTRQEAATPSFVETQTLKIQPRSVPGRSDVTVRFASLEASAGGEVIWRQPRFTAGKEPPVLLKDYGQIAARYEIDLKRVFADTAAYLAAADGSGSADNLDPVLLQRWKDILALGPAVKPSTDLDPATMVPAVVLEPLDVPEPGNPKWPAIKGWRSRAGELPVAVANTSDKAEHIPGLANAHKIVVHPSPDRFVAAAWTCPADGRFRIDAQINHVHPGCGNGILWFIEVRRGDRSAFPMEGVTNPGQGAKVPTRELGLAQGDVVLAAVDPRDGSHVCDLTEVNLTLTELEGQKRVWDLARDCADRILEVHPQWRFVMGSTKRNVSPAATFSLPPDSILGKWRVSRDPMQAKEVQALLSGERPAKEKTPDRVLYDSLVSVDSAFIRGLDPGRLTQARPAGPYGLEAARFSAEGDLVLPSGTSVEIRLPSALFREHDLTVEAKIDPAHGDRVVQFQLATSDQPSLRVLDGKQTCVATGGASKQLASGLDEFRRCFPMFLCYPRVVPDDEAVCLKLFHRDDEPLVRLFLDDAQTKRLDRLWEEHRFISQWPVTEHKNLPLFIGFVSQDGGAEALRYFEGLREPFRKRAEEFEKGVIASEPAQLGELVRFAAQAWRRPLADAEQAQIRALYEDLRRKEMAHAEALRLVMARILVSPAFLFRLERPAPGLDAQPVSDWELATRLSYFLWASEPDAELRRLAAEGKLREPAVLAEQVGRMVKDPKIRGLSVEFAAQWLHVKDFRKNREKNEKLFPAFDDRLRNALFEESVLFFREMLQGGRPAHELIDGDFVYVNALLAAHYGIPGIKGAEFRRVDGVKKFGRGGMLALGSVLTQESGASRTSPVLRGNWLVETLLGERLPKPPANVPRLPEAESDGEMTVREMVARHTSLPECQSCHVRIDPFGFAMEKYDPIGRFREKDLAGRAVDVKVQLKDGTQFEGLDGLRSWLLGVRRKDVERTFCRKLLG